ncbi:KGG domain-containing protein [Lysobacter sp. 2RAF19]
MANQTRGTSNRGFASMDPETQRKIAQKGGEAVSRDREHMSMIGRKGGEASGGNRTQNTPQNAPPNQFGGNEPGGNR